MHLNACLPIYAPLYAPLYAWLGKAAPNANDAVTPAKTVTPETALDTPKDVTPAHTDMPEEALSTSKDATPPKTVLPKAILNRITSGDPAAFTLLFTFPTGDSPDFVVYSHDRKYAAVTNGADTTVSVYAVDCGTGYFTEIDGSPFPTCSCTGSCTGTCSCAGVCSGTGTCSCIGLYPSSIAYSPNVTYAAVTNAASTVNPSSYSNDSVAVYSVNAETGALTLVQVLTNATNPEIVTPFSIAYSPDGLFAAVANFDNVFFINDNISIYSVSKVTGKLTLIPSGRVAETGKGPLVVAYSPNGKFAAVTLNEASVVAIFTVDPTTGAFTDEVDVPTGNFPFGVAYSHNGKFAAVANSADDTVSTYTVDPVSGVFTATTTPTVSSGAYPTYVAFSSDDALLAVTNTADGTVTVYCVDPVLGNLTETQLVSNSPAVPITTGFEASGIQFSPCTDFAAVTSYGADTVSVYDINSGVCS